MIEPTQLANEAATAAGSGTTGVGGSASIDQQEFLMLFINQLQNQDPLNPLDSNGLTEQLAQFSSLEQLYNINSNLESLGEVLGRSETADPLSFLDREITAPGNTISLEDGEATPVIIDAPEAAVTLEAVVRGPDGNRLRTLDLGFVSPGESEFVFDGKDEHGVPLPDGTYTVQVIGYDPNDEELGVETFLRGTVTGVDLREQPPVLYLGARRVRITEVRAIEAVGREEDDS